MNATELLVARADWIILAAVTTFAGLAAAACYALEAQENKAREAQDLRSIAARAIAQRARRVAARPSTTTNAKNGEGR